MVKFEKKDKTKILMTNGRLMKVENIAKCSLEHSAILLTCIKRHSVSKTIFFCLSESGRFTVHIS